jgi:hypothetical protein
LGSTVPECVADVGEGVEDGGALGGIEGVVGVLIFISPWVLGFTALTPMAWSAWIVGVLAVILAASVLFLSGTSQQRLVGQH